MSAESAVKSWTSFRYTLTKLDRTKINKWIAVRNALGVAVPLAIGIALHNPVGVAAVTTGALNVSFSDGRDPYRHRAERMLLWTILGGIAVFVGSVTGSHSILAVLVAVLWAFVAGLGVAVSGRTGDLGLNTLVAVIVFGARAAFDVEGAAITGALVVAGGLLQTALSLLFWPLRRTDPERVALGQVYAQLSRELTAAQSLEASDPDESLLDTQLKVLPQPLQESLDALGADHSVESERFRMLLDQADRIRLSAFSLRRARQLLKLAAAPRDASERVRTDVDGVLDAAAKLTAAAAECIAPGKASANMKALIEDLDRQVDDLNANESESNPAVAECAAAADALAGQLRAVATLVSMTSSDLAAENRELAEQAWGWRLQIGGWVGTLRANLNWRSAYFRHAVRMAVCVAIGDAIGRCISWQRSYWMPMTIAVVLKPDFASTFSRGSLRLIGTFGGLVIATGLYHVLPTSSHQDLAITQLLLVGIFTLALRSLGPANYGIHSASIAGLVVFLIAATGISPKDVVVERGINTLAGGVLALIAYAVWPTWERIQINDVLARFLDALREYLHETAVRCGNTKALNAFDLDEVRYELRRARSAAEASVDRVKTEPGADPQRSRTLVSILASSRAVAHCILGLEASLLQGSRICGDTFLKFTNDVEFTLYFLADALRGSRTRDHDLPTLRQDYRNLLRKSGELRRDDLIVTEADRLTVATNTLREQVLKFVAVPESAAMRQEVRSDKS